MKEPQMDKSNTIRNYERLHGYNLGKLVSYQMIKTLLECVTSLSGIKQKAACSTALAPSQSSGSAGGSHSSTEIVRQHIACGPGLFCTQTRHSSSATHCSSSTIQPHVALEHLDILDAAQQPFGSQQRYQPDPGFWYIMSMAAHGNCSAQYPHGLTADTQH